MQVNLKQLAEKVEACRQLQASFEGKEADLTKLKRVLASQDATRNEMQQQLKSECLLATLKRVFRAGLPTASDMF